MNSPRSRTNNAERFIVLIRIHGNVAKASRGGDRELGGIIQSFVEEGPNPVQFQDRDKPGFLTLRWGHRSW